MYRKEVCASADRPGSWEHGHRSVLLGRTKNVNIIAHFLPYVYYCKSFVVAEKVCALNNGRPENSRARIQQRGADERRQCVV